MTQLQELVSTFAMLGTEFSMRRTYEDVEVEDDLTGMTSMENQHTGWDVVLERDDVGRVTVFHFDEAQEFVNPVTFEGGA
jgi:hypothetical protein